MRNNRANPWQRFVQSGVHTGFETEETYYEIAKRRIREEMERRNEAK
ncbi:hypothetical protein PRABACTJOHN_03605 [Parabacteroides johnsonii DSM 18315]|uniref:Uncharacterized protein n=1 Tax=Parabacteroides johnsonii DSM 18315 TaxID=537006 RepID=B7BEX6_9BACT|nr:hypothetical protein [Phocaeicola dorei]EEC95045.1 hypothetical protein PRABACTJOHN_03605 [Parabacteroides johnsonii DSM 18315]